MNMKLNNKMQLLAMFIISTSILTVAQSIITTA